jgi:hypothetical protein
LKSSSPGETTIKKQSVWITDDGQSFTSETAAFDHEFEQYLANDLILLLRMQSQTADLVARNYREIARIASETKRALKGEADRSLPAKRKAKGLDESEASS